MMTYHLSATIKSYGGAALMGLCLYLALALSFEAQAQNMEKWAVEKLDDQEQSLPVMPRIKGPLTIIPPAALLLASFDQDHDYVVSGQEGQQGVDKAFLKADADLNGRISLFELEDWRLAALGSLDAFPGNLAFDRDFDNQIGQDEFKDALLQLFQRHDKDMDGQLIMSELMQILEIPNHIARPMDVPTKKLSDGTTGPRRGQIQN